MHISNVTYQHAGTEFHGFRALNSDSKTPRPAVLVAHDWSGRNQFACQKAELLAEMGYVGFAIDMYGEGRMGKTTDEKIALMQPLISDRAQLRARIRAAFDVVAKMPEVDSGRIAAIGFCFGGLCVLDLARSGADLKGVVSFHGLLNKPEALQNESIRAKMLVLHGYDDPMVRPLAVQEFCQEMTEAKVDWQVHMYGQTQHAFTNPEAHDPNMGTMYNERSEQRSLQSMVNFLREIMD